MVRFAPSSAAILRAIFRTSLSEKPIARSAFRSWQMPKKSTFGFIAISPIHKAGTVFHDGIRFPRFLTFVLPALFVATPQADGRFQTAAAGCRSTGLRPSEDLSELPPLRSVVAGQVYHCRLAGSSQKQLANAASGWMGTARHLIGPSLCRSKSFRTGGLRASARLLFPRRVLPTDVLLNRIFSFQRTSEVNVPLFNPTEIRVLSTLLSKIL